MDVYLGQKNLKATGGVPVDIYELYDSTFQMIEKRGRRGSTVPGKLFAGAFKRKRDDIPKKILSWIYYAKVPLQMSELQEALAIRDGEDDVLARDRMSQETILSTCSGLIIYQRKSEIVSFAHETIREYFDDNPDRLINEGDMAKACLTYLLFKAFESGPFEDQTSFEKLVHGKPLGQYAAQNWGKHMKGADRDVFEHVSTLLTLLLQSTKRVDTITQLATASLESGWVLRPKHAGKQLSHLLAENDLSEFLKDVIENVIIRHLTERAN